MKNWGNVFDSDGDGNSVVTFAEDDLKGQAFVQMRQRASVLFSSSAALMEATGIYDACRKVKVKDNGGRVSMIDPNEIARILQTVSIVAQRCEWEAEKNKRLYPRVRKFRCAAYVMELFYKRKQMPAHLAKPLRSLSPDLQKEKQKLINSLGRQWQRRYRKLHLVQSFTHLALVDKEIDPDASEKKQARIYVDRHTDLLIATATHGAGIKGEPLSRYNKAAEMAVKDFRATKESVYAPDWTLEQYNQESGIVEPLPKTKQTTSKPSQGRSWKEVTEAIAEQVKVATLLVNESERDARCLEIHAIIDEQFYGSPDDDGGRVRPSPVSSVISNGDTAPLAGVQNAENAPIAADTSSNLLNENEESNDLDVTHVSYLNLQSKEQARQTIEAFKSVGATGLKAVFVGMYPVKGEAEKLGSEPKQNGVSMSPDEFLSRIPEYLRRNREEWQNIAVRAWGAIIQVDDCSPEIKERLKPFAFFIEETSKGNYQVWLALPRSFVGSDGKITEEGKALRSRLLKKFEEQGETANGGAYGSTRLPGTFNVKEKHAPNFPRIQVEYIAPGRIVTPEELDAAGLLMPAPAPVLKLVNPAPRVRNILAGFPDHHSYVAVAPTNDKGEPDESRADIKWAICAMGRGFAREEIASELRSLREKAAKRDDYVRRTLDAAERWLATHSDSDRGRVAV